MDLLEFARIHFQSYWGWFGWLNIKLPEWVYWLLALLVLAAVLGLVLRIVYSVSSVKYQVSRKFVPDT